jgi:hypothetical protein
LEYSRGLAPFASVSYDKHLEATLYGDGLESANGSGLREVHIKKIRDLVDLACDRIHRQHPRPSARESVAPKRLRMPVGSRQGVCSSRAAPEWPV